VSIVTKREYPRLPEGCSRDRRSVSSSQLPVLELQISHSASQKVKSIYVVNDHLYKPEMRAIYIPKTETVRFGILHTYVGYKHQDANKVLRMHQNNQTNKQNSQLKWKLFFV